MACKCCKPKPDHVVYSMTDPEYSGIEVMMHHKGELRVRYYDGDDENFTAQDIININFCPMCGRDLREGR